MSLSSSESDGLTSFVKNCSKKSASQRGQGKASLGFHSELAHLQNLNTVSQFPLPKLKLVDHSPRTTLCVWVRSLPHLAILWGSTQEIPHRSPPSFSQVAANPRATLSVA